jgi:hypothetical protein
MDDKKIVMIPFVAHESAMNRMERANKRLWIAIIVMIIAFFIYLLVPSEIEDTTQSVEDINSSEIHQNIGD